MNIDLYTKTILTVIAACLVWMCLSGVTPSTFAQGQQAGPTRVILVDERNAPLNTANGLRVDVGTQPIPVTLSPSQTLPVAIMSIQRRGTWEPIVVDVLKQPPTLMPTP